MGDEFRKGLASAAGLAGLGLLAQITDPQSGYYVALWAAALLLLATAPVIWFWPQLKQSIGGARTARGVVRWRFEETDEVIQLEWRLATPDSPLQFFVPGFMFSGKNVSGLPIYRPDAFVTVEHNSKVVPLYIVADGQWIEFSEAKEIPAEAEFQIGCQMRGDTLHCAEWTERLSPEQFLREIGGFRLTFSFDGTPSRIWRFTTEQLRRQFEKQKSNAAELARKTHPPSVRRHRS
jgi:hypothetical protein